MNALAQLMIRRKWSLVCAFVLGGIAAGIAYLELPYVPRDVIAGRFEHLFFAPDNQTFATVRELGERIDAGFAPWHAKLAEIVLWDANSKTPRMSATFPKSYIDCVTFSSDSQKVTALVFGQESTSVRVWNADSGAEQAGVSSTEWSELLRCRAVFYSESGALHGFRRPDSWLGYQIWNIDEKRKTIDGSFPSWCMLAAGEPFPKDAGTDTIRFASHIEGHWDVVLGECYPAMLWGGSLTFVDPIAVSTAGKLLIRVVSRQNGQFEIWDLTQGTCKKIAAANVSAWRNPALSPDKRFIVVGAAVVEKENLWKKIRRWLGLSEAKAPAIGGAQRYIGVEENWSLIETANGRTNLEFPGARQASFSRMGDRFAVLFEDRAEIWDMPPSKPWGKMAVAFFAGFAGTLILAFALRAVHQFIAGLLPERLTKFGKRNCIIVAALAIAALLVFAAIIWWLAFAATMTGSSNGEAPKLSIYPVPDDASVGKTLMGRR